MYFSWNYNLTDLIFHNLNVTTLSACIISIFVVFALAFIIELLQYGQMRISKNFNADPLKHGIEPVYEYSPLVQPLNIPSNVNQIKRKRLLKQFILTIMRMVTLTLGYIVMLISMDYYYGHFIAIILGLGFGHYIFDSSTTQYKKISRKSETRERNPIIN